MSIPIPLTVRLSTARVTRDVTADLRDLTIRAAVPGGYTSATISLDRPLILQPDEIGYYGKLVVYDARTAEIVWAGRLEDPGRSAGRDGQVWDIAAVGPSAHAQDRTVPLIYVDRDLTRWTPVEVTQLPAGQRSTGEDETIFPGEVSLVHRIPNGTPLTTNSSLVASRYLPIYHAGQKIARLDYRWDTGRTTTSLRVRSYARQGSPWATNTLLRDDAANTAGGGSSPRVIGTDWTAGRDVPEVRIQWTGAGATVGDDVTWGAWAGLVVLATRYGVDGAELLTGASYGASTVLAHQVVADLLGRLLAQYDGVGATIANTAYAIEQLAYPDGVTAAKVLDDLMQLEPAYYWAAWEPTSSGKYRFEWSAWPTSVRYEADLVDGYDSQGSADGLYDAVRVRYLDGAGAVRTVRRTQSVPELTAAGITREGFLDLSDTTGSKTNAERAGDQWLADHLTPPNAGRLRIARPILDLAGGRMAQPWEIRPGALIRVRGIQPRPDALNPPAQGRDGVTIFRIVSAEYRASDAAAVLELDSYSPTTARALADLARRNPPRR